ncbi:DNA-binding protein [Pseudoxanthomonas sp. Soil82]|uniref:DNA-binding protein n=1 Tax=Pseudoxanthomonas sp. Soil82 TaxID=3157341 RepID=UPI00338FC7F8
MARGITEIDVHQAADALVGSGERPTVERIRAHLGTGSPNTVTRWLDTWWRGLGSRLQGRAAQLAIPDAPEAVTTLAGQLWAQALTAAQQYEAAGLERDRAVLSQERARLEAEQDAAKNELVALRNEASKARAQRDLTLAQAGELQQLIDQLRAQVADLTSQRDGVQERVDRLEAERTALSARLDKYKAAGEREREAFELHRRTFEDRAYREVDLARQAAKDARTEMAARLKTRDVREATLGRERDDAIARSASLQAELDVERAHRQGLENELKVLRPALAHLSREESINKRNKGSKAKSQARKGKSHSND